MLVMYAIAVTHEIFHSMYTLRYKNIKIIRFILSETTMVYHSSFIVFVNLKDKQANQKIVCFPLRVIMSVMYC